MKGQRFIDTYCSYNSVAFWFLNMHIKDDQLLRPSNLGDRSFTVARPHRWRNFSPHLHEPQFILLEFQRLQKTNLFIRGPRRSQIDSWGTAPSISLHSDKWPFNITLCFLPLNHPSVHFKTFLEIPWTANIEASVVPCRRFLKLYKSSYIFLIHRIMTICNFFHENQVCETGSISDKIILSL